MNVGGRGESQREISAAGEASPITSRRKRRTQVVRGTQPYADCRMGRIGLTTTASTLRKCGRPQYEELNPGQDICRSSAPKRRCTDQAFYDLARPVFGYQALLEVGANLVDLPARSPASVAAR